MSEETRRVALITGVTGQDGSYLADRRTSNLLRSRIERIRQASAVYNKSFFLHYGDLSDATTLRQNFQKVKPAEVYHLAGQSHVDLSFVCNGIRYAEKIGNALGWCPTRRFEEVVREMVEADLAALRDPLAVR